MVRHVHIGSCFGLSYITQIIRILVSTMLALRCNTSAAELFYLRHLRTCAATAYGSNKTGHAGHGNVLGTSWLSFLGLEAAWNALLQSMLVLCLFVQLVSRCVLWICDYILRCAKVAVAYLWRAVVALLQSMLGLKFSPLELAACFHIIDASERATVFFTFQGGGPEPARLLLSVLCLMLAMMSWHVPRCIGCHMLLCRTLYAMLPCRLHMYRHGISLPDLREKT